MLSSVGLRPAGALPDVRGEALNGLPVRAHAVGGHEPQAQVGADLGQLVNHRALWVLRKVDAARKLCVVHRVAGGVRRPRKQRDVEQLVVAQTPRVGVLLVLRDVHAQVDLDALRQ